MKSATEYARVSHDKSGRLRSVSEQSFENRDAADENGWAWIPTTYAEEGEASASEFGTVKRVGFASLLSDLQAGAFPADVLILWAASRGSRQMEEWLPLINALKAHGVLLYVTEEDRTYDVRKAKDRRDLIDAANEAEYYSGRLSGTLKRAHRATAREGRWNGMPPYGYKRVYSEDGEVSQVEDPATAEFVREAFKHVAAGGSIAGLMRKWNEAGDTGRTWNHVGLRYMLTNPAYVGIRTHTPRSGHEPKHAAARAARTTTEYAAQWPALVDPELAERVRLVVTNPTRTKHSGKTAPAHLLSGIALCAVCDAKLSMRRHHGRMVYRCTAGHVTIGEADADEFVVGTVIAYLQRQEVRPPSATDDAEVTAAQQAVTDAEAYLAEVEQAAEQGTSPLLVAKMEQAGQEGLAAARAKLRQVSLPDALEGALPTEPMTPAVWDGLPLERKRLLLRAVFGIVGAPRVSHGGKGSHRIAAGDRVTFGQDE